MYQVQFIISRKNEDEFTRRLFESGAGSVTVHKLQAGKLRIDALFEDIETARSRFPDEYFTFSWLSECEWKYKWLEGYKGVKISRDIYIQSALIPDPHKDKYRHLIRLDPRDAFGDGNHPTTALCLSSLHEILSSYSDDRRQELRFLDAGTGTGVLAILAAQMGLKRIDAVDLDREAAARARENFALNGLGHIRLFCSDIKSFRSKVRYDIVAANLLTGIFVESADRIRSLARPSAVILLSGVSDQWDAEMREFFSNKRFLLKRHVRKSGWNCYVLINPDAL